MAEVTRTQQLATVGNLTRDASVVSNTWDPDERTIEVMFSSGAAAPKYDWRLGGLFSETLEVTSTACDLTRLNAGASVVDQHNVYSGTRGILGVVESAWIKAGKAYARIRFTKREEWAGVVEDIATGITRNFSVGYWVHNYKDVSEKDSDVKRYHATKWEPFELSPVCVPAEVGAGTRAEDSKDRFDIPVVDDDSDNEEDMTREFGTGVAPTVTPPSNEAPSGAAQPAPAQRSEAPAQPPAQPQTPAPQQRSGEGAPAPLQPHSADDAAERQRIVDGERTRVAAIEAHCEVLRLPQAEVRSLVALGRNLSEITGEVAAAYQRAFPVGTDEINTSITVGDEDRTKRRTAAVEGLVARMSGRAPAEDIGEFRNRSVEDIVRLMEHGAGNDGLRMTAAQVQSRAFHVSGDLPFLLEEAGRRILRDRYEVQADTWAQWCREVDLRDFREHDRIQLGDAPELEKVPDGAKITYGTFGESKETMRLASYGKGVAFGRQALINDDLSAFADIIQAQSTRVADLVSTMVYAELTDGKVGGQGLYVAGHNNTTTGVLSVENLGKARAKLGKQKTTGGMPMNLKGKFLIVPVELGHIAEVLTTNVTPGNANEVNPYAGRFMVVEEGRLSSALQWYIVADPNVINTIDVGWLQGNRGPQFGQMECQESRGLKWHVWADVTAKAIDFRGVVRSSGA